jgi:hypothetical protein
LTGIAATSRSAARTAIAASLAPTRAAKVAACYSGIAHPAARSSSMPDTPYVYEWNSSESLANLRDRFIRAEVQNDFEAHPEQGSIELADGLVATPVADNRYTVIWRRIGEAAKGRKAQVKAVVAAQYWGEDAQALRRKLQRAVETQYQGRLTLE